MDAIARAPVPVTVVTGFLGAGKTTIVNRWVAEAPRGDIAVIVNEAGDIGIDGALLEARARRIVEIPGGCVCCTTQAELVRALADLAAGPSPPGRILVETSGAASPAGVLRAIGKGGPAGAHALDGVVTVVDATRVDALEAHDLALEQLGYADIVVLSRADQCDADARTRAGVLVATHNAAAVVVSAARGALAGAPTLTALLEQCRTGFVAAHEVPPPGGTHRTYESVSLVIDGEVDGERFADFMESDLGRFAGRLLRTKGILAVAGMPARMIVQGVADLVDVTFGASWEGPRTSRLVVIGFGLDRDALTRAFDACAAGG